MFNADTDQIKDFKNCDKETYSVLPLADGVGLFAGYDSTKNRQSTCYKFTPRGIR